MPIPKSGSGGTREPRPASSAARSSPPAAGSAAAVYFRPVALGLALPIVAALSGGDGAGQASHGRPMAPSGLPSVLEMALQIRAAFSGARDSRSDSADERRQPALGCAPDPRRAAQARHRGQPSDRREVHGAKAGNTFSELADFPAQ